MQHYSTIHEAYTWGLQKTDWEKKPLVTLDFVKICLTMGFQKSKYNLNGLGKRVCHLYWKILNIAAASSPLNHKIIVYIVC